MVRRRFHPLIAFAAVIAAAGSVTAAGLTFTAHTVSRTVAELPQVKTRVLPSYVVRLPVAKAAALDVSKAVPVRPAADGPGAVAQIAAIDAPALPDEPSPQATLVAEVTPLSAETVEAPASDARPFVVRSDVFVRSGPSKSYETLGTLRGGEKVAVTGEDGGWLNVRFGDSSGWVYQRYLVSANTETVAVADNGRAPF